MSDTQELRTNIVWDTTDVDRGLKRVESACDRLGKAEEKAAQKSAQIRQKSAQSQTAGSRAGHADQGNLIAGVRDLAEGRTMNALTRFTSAAKAGGMAVAGIFAAYKVGKVAFDVVRESMEETDKAAVRLNENLMSISRSATFMTAGAGKGALGGSIEALQQHQTGQREQRTKLSFFDDVKNSDYHWDYWLGAYDKVRSSDLVTGLGGSGMSQSKKWKQSRIEGKLAAQQERKQRERYTESLGTETATTRMRAEGNDFAASRMNEALNEKQEIADAKKIGASEKDLELIKEKFEFQRRMTDMQEETARRADTIAANTGDARLMAAGSSLSMSTEDSQRTELTTQVTTAKILFEEAKRRADAQKGSLQLQKEQTAAAYAQAEAEMRLAKHVQQTAIARKTELGNMKAENAAMRMDNNGRADKAALARSRQSNEMAITQALRDGKPELAKELREQQMLAEAKMAGDKLLNPDGTKRRRGAIAREERMARNTERRRDKFNKRFEDNGGLTNVHRGMDGRLLGAEPAAGSRLGSTGGLSKDKAAAFSSFIFDKTASKHMSKRGIGSGMLDGGAAAGFDPITKARLTPEQIFDRKNRPENTVKKEQDEGAATQTKIYQLLMARLPAAAQ